MKDKPQGMNILLVQLSFLGDMILSTPVIAGIKKIHPKARLTVLTTPLAAALIQNDPLVDTVLTFDKRGRDKSIAGMVAMAESLKIKGFDRVYCLHRSYRTAMLLALAKIPERIGFKDAHLSFLYTARRVKKTSGHAAIRNLSLLFDECPESELATPLRLFAPHYDGLSHEAKACIPETGDIIVLAPGSAWKTKQWHWQGYASVARHFCNLGKTVVLMGGAGDRAVCQNINEQADVLDCSGRLTLMDTLYLMSNSRLLVCNDSMALHMASAFRIPTVAVFCATSPDFGFGPWENPNSVVVQDDTLGCKPCRRHGSNQCPEGTGACMTLDAASVIRACTTLL